MGKEEFFLQVFQRRIVEIELPFERAVGSALTAPEQVNNLVEYGIKTHSSPPQPSREGTSLDDDASYQNAGEVSTRRYRKSRPIQFRFCLRFPRPSPPPEPSPVSGGGKRRTGAAPENCMT